MAENRIKIIRTAQKMTQKELADRLGLSQSHIAMLEKGERSLDIDLMSSISTALGVKPYELLPQEWQPKEITPEEKEILRVIRKNAPSQGADNSHIPAQATDKKDISQPPAHTHKSNER